MDDPEFWLYMVLNSASAFFTPTFFTPAAQAKISALLLQRAMDEQHLSYDRVAAPNPSSVSVKESGFMNCTFCGAENREENRFCGMCGVRFERRVKERRVENGNLKCASCGHANEPGHKFCGMCGARTERRRQERREIGEGPRAVAMANAQLPTPELSAGRRSTEVLDAPEP